MHELELTACAPMMSENAQPPASACAPGARSSASWRIAALVYSVMSAFSGLALGYVLSGQPDLALVRAKLTGNMDHAMRLRIDYELRKASFCERSPHCRRVSVGYR